MAVHMLRIKCQPPQNAPVDQLRQGVETWVGERADVLPAQHTPITLYSPATGGSEVEHCWADYRFAWASESKTDLLDTVEYVLQQFCSWWRIKYHVCDHDSQNRDGCSWDDVREYGPVPSELD